MGTALVLGAGFAGLTAAVELAARGLKVTVLERRPSLGGRASSYTDRATGERCDNGQHLLIAGYRNTIAFLERIGAAGDLRFDPDLEVRFVARDAPSACFRAASLPAPLHLVSAFLHHPLLGVRDRLAVARAALAILRLDEREVEALEPVRFVDWLERNGQPRAAIDAFWEVFVLATVNQSVRVASALPVLRVLRLGFLGSREAARLGYAVVGLGDLYAGRAAAFVRARGGEVRTRARVAAIETAADGVACNGGGGARVAGVRLEDGERLAADLVVSALPFPALEAVAPGLGLVPPGLEPSPIVNVHVWLDRGDLLGGATFAALLGTRLAQWVWDRRRMMREPAPGGHLSVTISGADLALRLSRAEVEATVLADLRDLLPSVRAAAVDRVAVVKEPFATFRAAPGAERLRPPARTAVRGLYRAGDWTATGLPSTIEGAVISGLRAVEAATGEAGLVRSLDARPDWPVRLLRRLPGR